MALAACGCSAAPARTIPAVAAVDSGGVPSTDIYLYHLARGFLSRGPRVVNLTNRPGYDNQPAFVGSTIYYTSIRGGQADIYRFDRARHSAFTHTPESEYSAALTPDGGAIAVVRVEQDSAQRLWRFPLDGGAPSLVLRGIKPVGYFAWLDSTTLALFVLGSPSSLQIADTRTGTGRVVTTDLGRSLQRVPGGRRASFVQRVGGSLVLRTVDPQPRADGSWDIETVAALPDGAEYVVWKSETELYTGAGSRVLRLRRPATRWEVVADFGGAGIRQISRLALHPNGRELAFVGADPRRERE